MQRLIAATALAVAVSVAGACGGGGGDGDDNGAPPSTSGDGTTGGCTADDRMDVYSAPDPVHTDSPQYSGPLPKPMPTYSVNPPSGGDHLSRAAPPGIYTAPNIPPDGQLVHTLEHGYVILWYRPDVAADQVAVLRRVRDRFPRDTVIVERAGMPVPVAATAWKQRLLCERADADDLGQFVDKARNQAPEKVPH